MKKILSMVSTVVIAIVCLLSINTKISRAVNYVPMTIDGSTYEVGAADISINGNKINSDVPAFTYKNRTLAPLRSIGEALGAEVNWDEVNMIATLSLNGKTISVQIDSSKAKVNGVEKDITYEMPAKLVGTRTMIPLRFIAEELDCKVEWDESNYLVNIYTGYVNTLVDGKQIPLQKVNVTFEGNKMNLEFPAVIYNGRTLLPIRNIAEYLSATVNWDESGVINIEKDGNKISMKLDSTEYQMNGENKIIDNGVPPKLIGNKTMVPLRFLGSILGCTTEWKEESFTANIINKPEEKPVITPEPQPEPKPEPPMVTPQPPEEIAKVDVPKNGLKVVIDPGHGGKDPGALSYSMKNGGNTPYNEKTVCLNVARKLENLLRQRGYEVIMTRNDDYFVGLSERADISNNYGANAFVSIHFNSATPSATGIETFHFPGSASGFNLATSIQNNLIQSTGAVNRGVKQARFTVLSETACIAILAELGFISNPNDEYILQTDAYHDNVAQALAKGIDQYFGR